MCILFVCSRCILYFPSQHRMLILGELISFLVVTDTAEKGVHLVCVFNVHLILSIQHLMLIIGELIYFLVAIDTAEKEAFLFKLSNTKQFFKCLDAQRSEGSKRDKTDEPQNHVIMTPDKRTGFLGGNNIEETELLLKLIKCLEKLTS
ncbi:hypothetical protein WA026_001900 [Henosepilachna vigintioctopunctata]|uniref:Uncharacterized protein n=1 Tax=Henosepilachna vigintioctopunctata TaxID=420089 RepID=A0AAW1UT55_9CUCU